MKSVKKMVHILAQQTKLAEARVEGGVVRRHQI